MNILKNYGFLELIQHGKEKRPIVEKEAIMMSLR